jgi:chemotaxis protein MotB
MARKKKAAAKENAERWLLTYADLITLLMVFFVLLFSMSTIDKKKYQELAGSLNRAFNVNVLQGQQPISLSPSSGGANAISVLEQQNFQHINQIVQQIEQQNDISQQQITSQITKDGIAITVSGTLLFYNGTDQIKPDGLALLQKLGAYLVTLPNPIRVEGHTDDIPEQSAQYPTNWELSSARAVAVVRYFTDTSQMQPVRLSAVGYGQYQPIVPNDTRAHREENRRAVIVILYGAAAADFGVATPTPAP